MTKKKTKYSIPILCSDPIFKSVFMDCPNILSKFIYDITGKYYNNINLGMNEIPINRNNEKFKRCDFIINVDNNKIINIELNSEYSKTLLIKNTSYIFEIFSNNTSNGEDYNEDLEVIQININNFSRFKKPVLDYQIINNDYSHVYFNGLKIWDLDIVKCKKLYYSDIERQEKYLKWGALFSCKNIEDMEPILDELLNKKEAQIFMEKLKKITGYYSIMDEAEALRLDDKFRRSLKNEGIRIGQARGMKLGKNEGIKLGIIEMIKSMLINNAEYDFISKVSNKTVEEIKEIEKSIK